MTAQIGDSFKYQGKKYEIVAKSDEKRLFDPTDYGLHPSSISTDCWAGFWCEYDITDALYLQTLTIHCDDGNYPDICGRNTGIPYAVMQILASSPDFSNTGYFFYEKMNLKIPYTGKILVRTDFIHKYYIHMGYQRAYAYKELLEFGFEEGNLAGAKDLSNKAKEFRKKIGKKNTHDYGFEGNIPLFVKQSFSLSYDDKAWWNTEADN